MFESNTMVDTPPTIADDAEAGSPDRKRLLMFVGGGLALVVLIAVGWLVLAGGGSEEDLGPVVPNRSKAAADAKPDAAAPADDAAAQAAAEPAPEAYTEALGRDPFTPLYAAAAPESAADEATTTGGTVTTTDGTATDPAADAATGTPVVVNLEVVTADGATFSIDGKPVVAKNDGSTFAEVFRLYGVFDNRCAGVLYGDESIVMCAGDSRTLNI